MAPHILFGTGSGIVPLSSPEEINSLFKHLKELPIPIYGIDTAAVYPAGDVGKSERLLGEASIGNSGFVLDTKVLASVQENRKDKGGALSRDNILWSSKESLQRLKVPKVRTLYAHTPDTSTPTAETVGAFGEVLKAGNADTWGVSNYTPSQLKEAFVECDKQGVAKPYLYQGMYHALCRKLEEEIIPVLRQNGVKYYAYSPTAGGLLTDRIASDAENNRPTRAQGRGAQRHNDRYVKPEIVSGLKTLYEKCQAAGTTVQGAALRWLVYHSVLGDKDAVILGASKIEQIDDSAAEIAKGPLEGLEKAFEELWETVKDVAPAGY